MEYVSGSRPRYYGSSRTARYPSPDRPSYPRSRRRDQEPPLSRDDDDAYYSSQDQNPFKPQTRPGRRVLTPPGSRTHTNDSSVHYHGHRIFESTEPDLPMTARSPPRFHSGSSDSYPLDDPEAPIGTSPVTPQEASPADGSASRPASISFEYITPPPSYQSPSPSTDGDYPSRNPGDDTKHDPYAGFPNFRYITQSHIPLPPSHMPPRSNPDNKTVSAEPGLRDQMPIQNGQTLFMTFNLLRIRLGVWVHDLPLAEKS
ncbi:hypothetical protein CI109_100524 [Kwoniella shandongensis]|uniref:Uncharacterized protein n=1 Tax=Kwoniella shandongensis TaxID=1734106 RepID=A0AAJ8LE04_9TREE